MKTSPQNLPILRKACFGEAPKPAREARALPSNFSAQEHE